MPTKLGFPLTIVTFALSGSALGLGIPTGFAQPPLKGGVSQVMPVYEHGIVGLDLKITPGSYPVVVQAFPGTPAAKAGFLPNMVILAVDGNSVMGLSQTEVDVAISDTPGQRIQFLVSDRANSGLGRPPRVLMLTVARLSELSPATQQLFR